MYPLIKQMAEAEKELEKNFIHNGKVYLVRCPKCKRENWSGAVSSGVCAWCGFDANKLGEMEKTLIAEVEENE
jgi:ribosomal protein L37E